METCSYRLLFLSHSLTGRTKATLPNFAAAKRLLQASLLIDGNPGNALISCEANRNGVGGHDLLKWLKALSQAKDTPFQPLAKVLCTLRNSVCSFLILLARVFLFCPLLFFCYSIPCLQVSSFSLLLDQSHSLVGSRRHCYSSLVALCHRRTACL